MTAADRLRALPVVRPGANSTTQFVPFVDIDESVRDALADALEALERIPCTCYGTPEEFIQCEGCVALARVEKVLR